MARRRMHIALGFVAVLCLALAFLPRHAAEKESQVAEASVSNDSTDKVSSQTSKITTVLNLNKASGQIKNGSQLDGSSSNNSEKAEKTAKFEKSEKTEKPDAHGPAAKTASTNTSHTTTSSPETTTNNLSKLSDQDKSSSKASADTSKKDKPDNSVKSDQKLMAAETDLLKLSSKDKSKNNNSNPMATVSASTLTTASIGTTLNNEAAEKWRTIKIQKNDTLAKVFNRNGFSSKDLHEIMSSGDTAKSSLTSLQPGQTLKLLVGNEKKIDGLTLEIERGNTLAISRKDTGNGFEISQKQTPIEKKIAFGKGEIHTSLSGAAKRAGLDHNVVAQIVEIFGGNIDFSQDLRENDSFRVLYEQKYINDELVQTGNVLAAEIVNGGKKMQAVRYTDKTGSSGYFAPDGAGLNQAFLRSPVNFASISSGFGARRHPILHKMRQHKGVDYSAPHGAPVQATADAKVIFAGVKSGYGKVIELQHGVRYTTLYAHLSRFAKSLKVGTAVKQGQVIGFVGRTGLATGNHLHYEFRVDGIHRNPLTVALPKSKYIQDNNKRHFLAHAKEMIRLMDVHENKINVASAEFKIND
jgi:murein DD-endopeptidase MepM/ murein hydrolase activator NlpD